MDRLGDMTWKAYYAADRKARAREIEHHLQDRWDDPDPEVERPLGSGGLLSFPHTYISSSLGPLMRTVRAVHRSGKRKVLALGVVHSFDEDPEKDEFSLDGLLFMSELTSELLDMPRLEINRNFHIRDRALTEPGLIVKDIERKGASLKGELADDTALLLTGDLAHYGIGYGMKEATEDLRPLERSIEEGLSLLYEGNDHLGHYIAAKKILNDQAVVGILASTMLGPGLVHQVFTSEMTDYSEVLGTERPTLVASVFYGAYRP